MCEKQQWQLVANSFSGIVLSSAEVACRYLGFDFGEVIYPDGVYTESESDSVGLLYDIVLDDVTCYGHESDLGECRRSEWRQHNCNHREDVRLTCCT